MTRTNATPEEQHTRSLRAKGISYDTGFVLNGAISRECFDSEVVRRELQIIRDDLDLASYGIVKMLDGRRGDTYPDLPWEPKAAFAALADYYHDRPQEVLTYSPHGDAFLHDRRGR